MTNNFMTIPMLAEILRLIIPIWSEPSEKELKLSNEKSSLQITNYSVTIDTLTPRMWLLSYTKLCYCLLYSFRVSGLLSAAWHQLFIKTRGSYHRCLKNRQTTALFKYHPGKYRAYVVWLALATVGENSLLSLW